MTLRLPGSAGKPRTWVSYSAFAQCLVAARLGAALAMLGALAGCQPQLSIGEWTCSEDGTPSRIPERTAPVTLPWKSGFENQFCDYTELAGFCYADAASSTLLVSSPVHSGRHAAAFTINSAAPGESQTRCVRQGTLPTAAYYGAWYFIPEPTTTKGNWNLFHFRSGGDPSRTHGVLDVSLVGAGAGLQVAVFDMRYARIGESATPPPVPFGAWFHVQLFLKRAADMTGEVALYQDGEQIFDVTNLETDDATFGQWYVGNLADALSPSTSTLYVDDVSISSTL